LNATSAEMDGRAICQALHEKVAEISIILILNETKRGEDITGATFILTPPFTSRKLFNRIRSILKSDEGETLRVGKLTLNLGTRRVDNGSKERRLNPKELELLKVLMRSPGRVLSRKFLMKKIWETDFMGDTGTLNVHICRLRQKIEENPSSPQYVRTVRGVGYRFDIPEEANDETEPET
jgi:DNA-binding response OmpR family regulator